MVQRCVHDVESEHKDTEGYANRLAKLNAVDGYWSRGPSEDNIQW